MNLYPGIHSHSNGVVVSAKQRDSGSHGRPAQSSVKTKHVIRNCFNLKLLLTHEITPCFPLTLHLTHKIGHCFSFPLLADFLLPKVGHRSCSDVSSQSVVGSFDKK